jgi:hypothetical protein
MSDNTQMNPMCTTERSELAPVLPDDLADLPVVGVKDFIERFATARGVVYRRTYLDDLAETITRLSGDDIQLDPTEKLLVTLKRQGHLSGPQIMRLLANYLKERR